MDPIQYIISFIAYRFAAARTENSPFLTSPLPPSVVIYVLFGPIERHILLAMTSRMKRRGQTEEASGMVARIL